MNAAQREFVLISPDFDRVLCIKGINWTEAREDFRSPAAKQRYGADERIVREYGDWYAYERQGANLMGFGTLTENGL